MRISKFFQKWKILETANFFQKSIDKSILMCYNKGTKEREVHKNDQKKKR